MQDYCWDSLTSLYTFPATVALRDLARDCRAVSVVSPNSPSFSQSRLLGMAPKILGLRSTNELPRLITYYYTKFLIPSIYPIIL